MNGIALNWLSCFVTSRCSPCLGRVSVCHSGRSGGDGLRVSLREDSAVTTLDRERRPTGGVEGVRDREQECDRVRARAATSQDKEGPHWKNRTTTHGDCYKTKKA